jgi:hypothetical protein
MARIQGSLYFAPIPRWTAGLFAILSTHLRGVGICSFLRQYIHWSPSFSPTPRFQCQLLRIFQPPFRQESLSVVQCTFPIGVFQEHQILDTFLFGICQWQLFGKCQISPDDQTCWGQRFRIWYAYKDFALLRV